MIVWIIYPFPIALSIRKGVPWGCKAPSYSLHFILGWFSLFPRSFWIDGLSWWALTHVQIMSSGTPVSTGRLVPLPWQYAYVWLHSQQCIPWIALGFSGTYQFRALVLGWLPFLAVNHTGCAAAHTFILSVPCIPWFSLSAWGVRAGLLQGLMPQTPHVHWLIYVNQLVLLILFLLQSLEVWVPVSPRWLPRSHGGLDETFVPWDNSYNLLKR